MQSWGITSAHFSSGLMVYIGVCILNTDNFIWAGKGESKGIAEVRDVQNHRLVPG